MVTTKHEYIEKYPIRQTDNFLILGTIHPHRTECFRVKFFYGNENTLWNIIGEACGTTLKDVEQIVTFLGDNNVAISDMVVSCERKDEYITSDADIKPTELNRALKEEILHSEIETIFFTSAFDTNNAATLFFEEFNLKRPTNWRDDRDFKIDFYGKSIRCVILFSPSGQANRGIAGSKIYKAKKEQNNKLTVTEFRIDFYHEKFCNLVKNYKIKE